MLLRESPYFHQWFIVKVNPCKNHLNREMLLKVSPPLLGPIEIVQLIPLLVTP